jgi:RNA polymerase sigma factor (sigma-70 family)
MTVRKYPQDERSRVLEKQWTDHGTFLLRYLKRRLGSRAQEAEDLLQELFKNLQQSRIDFSQVQDWKAYLIEAAKNLSLRGAQRDAREPDRAVPSWADAADAEACYPEGQRDDVLEDLIMAEEFELVLAQMSKREQAIIQLKYVEGWTTEHIAQEIGWSHDQVERELTKARDRLKALSSQRNARKGT